MGWRFMREIAPSREDLGKQCSQENQGTLEQDGKGDTQRRG